MSVFLPKWARYRVKPGDRIDLDATSTRDHELVAGKEQAHALLKQYRDGLDKVLALLGAEAKQSLLVVLQGVDASGKDGVVRRVFTGVNPQHLRVVSFKEPGGEEQRHDYLWRIYRALPARGELGIFNRSHYEDVLVPYARGSITQKEARTRLRQIADLERIWTENGIHISKFFLHISYEEQASRFRSRLEEPQKHWKVMQSDFDDRRHWDKFQSMYEEVLRRTSTSYAPWHIVPADHKWYRDIAVAGIVLSRAQTLHPHRPMPKIYPKQYRLD